MSGRYLSDFTRKEEIILLEGKLRNEKIARRQDFLIYKTEINRLQAAQQSLGGDHAGIEHYISELEEMCDENKQHIRSLDAKIETKDNEMKEALRTIEAYKRTLKALQNELEYVAALFTNRSVSYGDLALHPRMGGAVRGGLGAGSALSASDIRLPSSQM